jgi:hypothetical protein
MQFSLEIELMKDSSGSLLDDDSATCESFLRTLQLSSENSPTFSHLSYLHTQHCFSHNKKRNIVQIKQLWKMQQKSFFCNFFFLSLFFHLHADAKFLLCRFCLQNRILKKKSSSAFERQRDFQSIQLPTQLKVPRVVCKMPYLPPFVPNPHITIYCVFLFSLC